MSNYQTVNLPRDLAERIARVCMFTMFSEDSKQLRAILARPSAPAERDERAAFERAVRAEWPQAPISRKRDLLPQDDPCYGDYCDEPLQRAWVGWRMRAWLEGSKPTVLSKCVLCDQLQADLTERDQQIDALRQGMKGDYDLDAWLAFVEEAPQLRLDAGRYRWLRSRDLETISKGGVFAGMTPDNLVLNEETLDHAIDAAMAPDYVEASTHGRLNGVPASPCAGCGVPGYTGNCDKCVPY